MLPSVLAIGAVVAVVLLLVGVFGQSDGTTVDDASPVGGGTPVAPSPTTPVPTPTVTPTPTAPPAPALPTEFPDIQVVVMNSTDVAGLATRVSDHLGQLGWWVGPLGNFAEAAGTTTVYYPPGYEEAARVLALFAPGPGITAPVIPAVPTSALTVVLGADAVDWAPPETLPGQAAEVPPTDVPETEPPVPEPPVPEPPAAEPPATEPPVPEPAATPPAVDPLPTTPVLPSTSPPQQGPPTQTSAPSSPVETAPVSPEPSATPLPT